MKTATSAAFLAGLFLGTVITAPPIEAHRRLPAAAEVQASKDIEEEMLRAVDPDLLLRAEKKGIYKRDEYPVLRSKNPFFLRGDFNGDGAMDVAVWVTQKSSGLKGVVVIHSTLDTVYYLGAGHGTVDAGTGQGQQVDADTWRVLPAGSIVQAVVSVPEIGAIKDQKFTFKRETLEFIFLGKASYAFYWANGNYWELITGD